MSVPVAALPTYRFVSRMATSSHTFFLSILSWILCFQNLEPAHVMPNSKFDVRLDITHLLSVFAETHCSVHVLCHGLVSGDGSYPTLSLMDKSCIHLPAMTYSASQKFLIETHEWVLVVGGITCKCLPSHDNHVQDRPGHM